MIKSIIVRFLKGMIAGAVSAMGLVSISQPVVWSDFNAIFMNLGIAGIYGSITGLLLALEKWSSWQE